MTEIRALSIAGPFAYCLATGWKTIELRSWKTTYRGLVLLHASSSKEWDYAFEWLGLTPEDCPKSAIQGTATLVDCIEYTDGDLWERDRERHRWLDADPDNPDSYEWILRECYQGKPPIGHVFEQPILFDEPISNVPGAFNYWQPKKGKQIQAFEQAIAYLNP